MRVNTVDNMDFMGMTVIAINLIVKIVSLKTFANHVMEYYFIVPCSVTLKGER